MSSVTTSTMVWVDCQPCCSICGLYTRTLAWPGRAVLAEAQVRERGAVQIQGVAIDQVGRRHRAVIVAHERLGEPRQRIVQLVVQTVGHALEQVGLLVLQPGRHGSSPIGDRSASSTDRKALT